MGSERTSWLALADIARGFTRCQGRPFHAEPDSRMRELLRTGDLVRLSFLQALLAEAGIDSLVLDANTGSLLPYGIVPRLMVADNDELEEARRVLLEAGESLDG